MSKSSNTLLISILAEEAALDYAQQVARHFPTAKGIPKFDLLILGMGPDGHTCSLFPGHKLLDETSVLIAPINDSPKPPPSRITMTFPLINSAKCCIFAVSGDAKAEIVKVRKFHKSFKFKIHHVLNFRGY